MENNSISSEQTVQDGKLYRHLNSLIVSHLRHNNLTQAATAVASATMTPLNVEAPPNKLLELVAKGLAAEKDDVSRGTSSSPFQDLGASLPLPRPGATAIDFRQIFYTCPSVLFIELLDIMLLLVAPTIASYGVS
ncbi:hypothetical protein TSUD_274590 [Trifolium subterraneum]|uniref:LisH domain-containing protein n=1 Tax=Trifolium subterraneum TaxID=3900 RepID=A0A2Z6MXM8_TRISU|nr:hypothetical protein TSUD_274590 [Trifolium subterraneum]